MMGAVAPQMGHAAIVRATPALTLQLHRLKPEAWIQFGIHRRAVQPNATLSDGTTIALY
jgi:hypothetical protein